MDLTGQIAPVAMRTDANNLVTTAATTKLPEQEETTHMVNMLRREAGSGSMDDFSHVRTEYCLADALTKKSITSDALRKAVFTGVLPMLDCYPLFRDTLQHRAFAAGGTSSSVSKESLFAFAYKSVCDMRLLQHVASGREVSQESDEDDWIYEIRNQDYWERDPVDHTRLYRYHVTPRNRRYKPPALMPYGIKKEMLSPLRVSHVEDLQGDTHVIRDSWTGSLVTTSSFWTGKTEFRIVGPRENFSRPKHF